MPTKEAGEGGAEQALGRCRRERREGGPNAGDNPGPGRAVSAWHRGPSGGGEGDESRTGRDRRRKGRADAKPEGTRPFSSPFTPSKLTFRGGRAPPHVAGGAGRRAEGRRPDPSGHEGRGTHTGPSQPA